MTGRRQEPQPLGRGWELPFLLLTGLAIALALGALLGLGLAGLLFGRGWVWPAHSAEATATLSGILHGTPGLGLPAAQALRVPTPGTSYTCIAVAELFVVLLLAGTAVLGARYRIPHDARGGMATRAQAQEALGPGALRRARPLIRPDLTGRQIGAGQ